MAILYIDDDSATLKPFKQILEFQGFIVITSESSEEGLKTLQERKGEISCVVCDGVAQRNRVEEFCHRNDIGFCLLPETKQRFNLKPVLLLQKVSAERDLG